MANTIARESRWLIFILWSIPREHTDSQVFAYTIRRRGGGRVLILPWSAFGEFSTHPIARIRRSDELVL